MSIWALSFACSRLIVFRGGGCKSELMNGLWYTSPVSLLEKVIKVCILKGISDKEIIQYSQKHKPSNGGWWKRLRWLCHRLHNGDAVPLVADFLCSSTSPVLMNERCLVNVLISIHKPTTLSLKAVLSLIPHYTTSSVLRREICFLMWYRIQYNMYYGTWDYVSVWNTSNML